MQQNAPGKTCWIDIAGIFMTVFDLYRISQLLRCVAGCGDLSGQLAACRVVALLAIARFFSARDAGDSLQICADKQFFHGASSFC